MAPTTIARRARTAMMTDLSSSKLFEGSVQASPGQSASTIFLGIMALVPVAFLFPMVVVCVNTAQGGVWIFLWWTAFCGLAVAYLASASVIWFGHFPWLPAAGSVKASVTLGMALPVALLMASMCYLAEYSHAFLATAGARELTDVPLNQLSDLASQDGVALLALRPGEGYIASGGNSGNASSFLITNISYGCHGVQVQKTCCRGGVTGHAHSSPCHDCSYWTYPETCPGAELLIVAPVWPDAASTHGRPAALAFQSRTSLFRTEAERALWAASQQASSPDFAVEYCRGGHLCAFVPRNVHVQAHWDFWHRGVVVNTEQTSVGTHNYDGVPAETALQRAQELAALQMQHLGRAGERVPLLWVPADTHQSFAAWETELVDSERSGQIGNKLLYSAAGLFGVMALATACWTHRGACTGRSSTDSDQASSV